MMFDFSQDHARVTMRGEFTFTDHAAFREIANCLLEPHSTPFVIDVSQLEFIDSAGLGMLLIARDEANKVQRRLVLRGPQGQVKRMFDVTKFDTLFTVEP